MARTWTIGAALALGLLGTPPATAQVPTPAALLADYGISPDEIARVEAGEFVSHSLDSSNDRELVAAFSFFVARAPGDLVSQTRQGLLDRIDPNELGYGVLSGAPSLDGFAKLTLQPGAAQRWTSAQPGSTLNLSSQEIATLNALGSGAPDATVQKAVHSLLLERLQAYQRLGLAGIAPYARSDGSRSPADDLRSASRAAQKLQKYVPAAYRMLLDYPGSKVAGAQENFHWTREMAHGEPNLSLTHNLYIPDGDAWVAVQRQFYASAGYNCEQAVAAYIPVKGGTVVVYTNRTSTDQVTGFGGGAKRAIGSKLLASELEGIFQKLQTAEKRGPS
jgi:hypothetical protein